MSSRRYGTFLESYERERTEMRAMQGDASVEDKISEMSLAFTHSNYSKLFKEDALVLNRLPLLCNTLRHYLSNNGIIAILICLHLIIIGLFSLSFARHGSALHYFARYLLSCGMYGFVGGFINYFAVTLFFTRIYGLCGSGIIYSRYQDICESVRTSIIDIFFDEAFLELYSKQKLSQQLVRLDIEGKLQSILQSETVEQLIDSELHSLAMSPEGQILSCAGINISSLKPLIKPFTLDLVAGIFPAIAESFFCYSQESGIQRLKKEVKSYTAKRRDKVTAERIVHLTRDVMGNHLSLLVVLGCAVGIFFGILSQVIGVGKVI